MRASSKAALVVATLMAGLLASVFSATPAAADRTITLYGTRAGGWGLTNTTITSPGPPLEIAQGENVTIFLTSADQFPHDWYIDYDNDASPDGNEPQHPGTFGMTTENFTFAADRNGTYLYRAVDSNDEPRMWGLITIHPPGTALPGGGGVADAATLAIVGLVIAVVAVVALYYFVVRKARGPRAPPPPPEE